MRISKAIGVLIAVVALLAISPEKSFAQDCIPSSGALGGTECVKDQHGATETKSTKHEVISWLKTITTTAAQVAAAIDVANEIIAEWGGLLYSAERLVYDFNNTLSLPQSRSRYPALASMPASDNALQRDRADQLNANFVNEDEVTRYDIVHTQITHAMTVADAARGTSQTGMANNDALSRMLNEGSHNPVDFRRSHVQLTGQQLSSSATSAEVIAQLTVTRNLRAVENFHEKNLKYEARHEALKMF